MQTMNFSVNAYTHTNTHSPSPVKLITLHHSPSKHTGRLGLCGISSELCEKLAGGRLNIKTQQQAVWSPLRGDMRECRAETQPGLKMCWWDLCVVDGVVLEKSTRKYLNRTQSNKTDVCLRGVCLWVDVFKYSKYVSLYAEIYWYETFFLYNFG